jgi:membrane protein
LRDLVRRLWDSIGRKRLADAAAALTYYSVLSLFPGLVALVSILGLVGTERTAADLIEIVEGLGPGPAADTLRGPIEAAVDQNRAGLGLVLGLAGAVWVASGYVAAFMRTAGDVHGADEAPSFMEGLLPRLALTVGLLLLATLVLSAIVLSAPVARAIGDVVGLGGTAIDAWAVARWVVLLGAVILAVAILYRAAAPAESRSVSAILPGGALAIAGWLVTSALFSIYVAELAAYQSNYGPLATVIVFLVWLWLSNLALLLGVSLNVELEEDHAEATAESAASFT